MTELPKANDPTTAARRILGQPAFQNFLTILVCYGLAALAASLWPSTSRLFRGARTPSWSDVSIVAAITAGFALLPVLVCTKVLLDESKDRLMSGLSLCLWYALPWGGLLLQSGWLSLAGMLIHLALLRRGSRLWRFVEYGSTGFSLLMLQMTFGTRIHLNFSAPLVAAVGIQAVLLTLSDAIGRNAWVRPPESQNTETSPNLP